MAKFKVIANSRHVSARWRAGMLHVNVPRGMCVNEAVRALVELAPRIMARRPKPLFSEGQIVKIDDVEIKFTRQSLKPKMVTLTGPHRAPVISVGSELSYDDDEVNAIISRLMCVVARSIAPEILLPRAREIAQRIGVSPASWKISRGHRTLGTCSSKRVIALSEIVVFLTPALRDYIICHELAHLTEMNHSSRFHELCNQYCDGREKELEKQLKLFKWPIIKL